MKNTEEINDTDLFDKWEELPDEVQKILETYKQTYDDCARIKRELKPLGYTYDYYLDACPTFLRRTHKKRVQIVANK